MFLTSFSSGAKAATSVSASKHSCCAANATLNARSRGARQRRSSVVGVAGAAGLKQGTRSTFSVSSPPSGSRTLKRKSRSNSAATGSIPTVRCSAGSWADAIMLVGGLQCLSESPECPDHADRQDLFFGRAGDTLEEGTHCPHVCLLLRRELCLLPHTPFQMFPSRGHPPFHFALLEDCRLAHPVCWPHAHAHQATLAAFRCVEGATFSPELPERLQRERKRHLSPQFAVKR
mmetsp:Transcript_38346/g.61811  ORF Transcript_38346/g.61811 Transcript_38346/m.61811 type:complete len:232 (+) Transcript_38346:975-1670(+)